MVISPVPKWQYIGFEAAQFLAALAAESDALLVDCGSMWSTAWLKWGWADKVDEDVWESVLVAKNMFFCLNKCSPVFLQQIMGCRGKWVLICIKRSNQQRLGLNMPWDVPEKLEMFSALLSVAFWMFFLVIQKVSSQWTFRPLKIFDHVPLTKKVLQDHCEGCISSEPSCQVRWYLYLCAEPVCREAAGTGTLNDNKKRVDGEIASDRSRTYAPRVSPFWCCCWCPCLAYWMRCTCLGKEVMQQLVLGKLNSLGSLMVIIIYYHDKKLGFNKGMKRSCSFRCFGCVFLLASIE